MPIDPARRQRPGERHRPRRFPACRRRARGIARRLRDRRPAGDAFRTGAGAALAGALLGTYLTPAAGGIILLLAELGVFVAATLAQAFGWWFPIGVVETVMMLSWMIGSIARFLVQEGKRRRVQSAFGRYLAPSLVERLADTDEDPLLGGEEREVSVMFADLSGFTALSGQLSPTELMAVTNRYLHLLGDSGGRDRRLCRQIHRRCGDGAVGRAAARSRSRQECGALRRCSYSSAWPRRGVKTKRKAGPAST